MRVLVTTLPGLGHFHPMVPLCRALRDAGHEVRVAASPPFTPVIEALGLDAIGIGPSWTQDEVDRFVPGFTSFTVFEGVAAFTRIATWGFGDELLALAEDWEPDVLVHDHTEFAAWMAGERLEIPWVPFAMTGRALDPPIQVMCGVEHFAAMRDHFGLPPDLDQTAAGRWLYLDAVPMTMTTPLFPPGPTVRPLRCVADDRSGDEGLPDWLENLGDRRLVYVTMGSVYNRVEGLLATVAAGAAALDVEVLVTVGRNGDPGHLDSIGPNVHVERYVPQSLLLDRCAAVVCHGGFGAVFGSLSAGVPLVIAPISADQPLNAFLAGEHGFGIACTTEQPEGAPFPLARPGDLRPEQITEALAKVLDDESYRAAAGRVATEIAAQPPVESAVGLIEQVVTTGAPVG